MSTTSQESDKDQKELLEYWTEERRAKAEPKPMPTPPPDQEDEAYNEGEAYDDEGEEPVTTPPNVSVHDMLETGGLERPGTMLAKPVKTPARWPYSCNGKLFFKWKGKDYVGSAGSIFLEILLTAAHNIYDEGEWSSNFLYYPGYPVYGKSWGWKRAAIFTAWRDHTNFAYDYAMILTNSSMREVGSMGSIQNLSPRGRTWTAFAYPAKAPYPGNQMYETTGSYISGSSVITMNNNDMTKGSSGGNWLTNHRGNNYVNTVQSHRPPNQPTVARAPYVNRTDFVNLLRCAATGNCR